MFFFSSRRRHTRFDCDWSSDVCSSDLPWLPGLVLLVGSLGLLGAQRQVDMSLVRPLGEALPDTLLGLRGTDRVIPQDRKSTRLNSSHSQISYAVFCLKKKKKKINNQVV